MKKRCDRPTVTLMLALAGVLACLLQTSRAWATANPGERAVGLEAQGVDPEAALRNPEGLDVRDANGRPVSAELIRAQLKKAQAAAAADATYASRLPEARRVTWALELFAGLATSLTGAAEHELLTLFADAGLPRPPQDVPALVVVVFTVALVMAVTSAVLDVPLSVPAKVKVLRC